MEKKIVVPVKSTNKKKWADVPVRHSYFIPKDKVAEFAAQVPEVSFEIGTGNPR